MPSNLKLDKGVFGRMTLAKCPKCDKIHDTYENWTGNGMLRRYCPRCLHVVCTRTGGMDDGTEFHKRAISMGR
jgi:phage FluMu protein Com